MVTETAAHSFVFTTASGFCGIAWTDAGIVRFRLPAASAQETERHLQRQLPEARPGTPPPRCR